MLHYLRTLFSIIGKRSDRFNLLKAYLKIILRAHVHHKFLRFFGPDTKPYFEIVLLGMRIRFLNYSFLLLLFEEIFIKEIYFFKPISPAPLIIDCGSNIGLSVLYFKRKYPTASVIAFEPDATSVDLLKENIENNQLSGIALKNVGLAGVAGSRSFFRMKDKKGSVNNSLIRSKQHDVSEIIATELLSDHIFNEVDFLKIDTEGSEGEILQNLCSTGKIAMINQLCIEYHPQCDMPLSEIEKLMIENGFTSQVLNDQSAMNKQIVYKR